MLSDLWVAKQMGHTDWTMIARVYGRWIPSENDMSGSKAAEMFGTSVQLPVGTPVQLPLVHLEKG